MQQLFFSYHMTRFLHLLYLHVNQWPDDA